MRYWIIWHDKDGTYVEEFCVKEIAEDRINEIHRLMALVRNGTAFDCCIHGKRLLLDTKEVSVVYVMGDGL